MIPAIYVEYYLLCVKRLSAFFFTCWNNINKFLVIVTWHQIKYKKIIVWPFSVCALNIVTCFRTHIPTVAVISWLTCYFVFILFSTGQKRAYIYIIRRLVYYVSHQLLHRLVCLLHVVSLWYELNCWNYNFTTFTLKGLSNLHCIKILILSL